MTGCVGSEQTKKGRGGRRRVQLVIWRTFTIITSMVTMEQIIIKTLSDPTLQLFGVRHSIVGT